MTYLIVVAHPDDEVLGAGASMYRLVQDGHQVCVCILSGAVEARRNRPSIDSLHNDVSASLSLLGVTQVTKGNFPNIQFNAAPHLHLVRFIEEAIVKYRAETIVTHHPNDLNNDHYHTSIACQAAARLFQRRNDAPPLKELLFMEVPSATDWSLRGSSGQFSPNTFVEVGEEAVQRKIEALAQYRGVMRCYPHPRSAEAIKALAVYRGGQAGMMLAEAFESVFRRGL